MTTSMSKFYPYCVRSASPLHPEFKAVVREAALGSLTLTYNSLIARLQKKWPTHDPIYPALEEIKATYDLPAPPKMTRGHKEYSVIRCLARFGAPPADLSTEHEEFVEDGYRFYVRRAFLRGNEPLTVRDVEYHIQASNLEFTKTKKEYSSWSCSVYMNVEGYFCAGQYPSIPGTMFGAQWGRSFNG
jgi:hypothetical protein